MKMKALQVLKERGLRLHIIGTENLYDESIVCEYRSQLSQPYTVSHIKMDGLLLELQ